jgi:hypothetical protein
VLAVRRRRARGAGVDGAAADAQTAGARCAHRASTARGALHTARVTRRSCVAYTEVAASRARPGAARARGGAGASAAIARAAGPVCARGHTPIGADGAGRRGGGRAAVAGRVAIVGASTAVLRAAEQAPVARAATRGGKSGQEPECRPDRDTDHDTRHGVRVPGAPGRSRFARIVSFDVQGLMRGG